MYKDHLIVLNKKPVLDTFFAFAIALAKNTRLPDGQARTEG